MIFAPDASSARVGFSGHAEVTTHRQPTSASVDLGPDPLDGSAGGGRRVRRATCDRARWQHGLAGWQGILGTAASDGARIALRGEEG
jgi:hypothetical protein